MSTRRARIKAVTALPPRRKNVENNDNIKPKPEPTKDDTENTKSPSSSQAVIPQEADSSPLKALPSPVRVRTPVNVVNVPTIETKVVTPATHKKCRLFSTPELSEKVSVITSISSVKSVFLSPQVRNSPQRKVTQFPPKLDLEKKQLTVTPEKNKQLDKICEDGIAKLNVNNSVTRESRNKDDYNVPSLPESVTEDAVMDGIIPLQAASTAPKPIALLKNEIISENAEVLFDPIVPLPSPSKVRPKLRPVPRLGPLRRNSVQGSASESEDESRRALLNSSTVTGTPTAARQRNDSHTSHSTMHSHLIKEVNRVRNDSVCSSLSQVAQQPAVAGSPVKEKHYSKSRRQDMSRRMAAMRRRRETVQRDTLTMYDLIFYNPTTKPIVPDQDEIEANEATQLDIEEAKKKEDNVDDPPPAKDTAPVPQMKLGPNGEIVLDEQSLVIKNSGNRQVSGVVREGAWSKTGGYYRRAARTAEWSDEETVRFYRALAALGTDFTMMQQLFPGRTRQDLKKKFKKEEKINGAQVDRALKAGNLWDVSKLNEDFVAEREVAQRAIKTQKDRLIRDKIADKERKQAAKELKVKECRSSRILGASSLPAKYHKINPPVSADEIIDNVKTKRQNTKAIEQSISQRSIPPARKVKVLSNISLSRNISNSEIEISADGRTTINTSNTEVTKDARTPKNTGNAEVTKDTRTPKNTSNTEVPKDTRTPTHDISSVLPKNIETGSLVVLTVEDPNAPTKKILQTYISNDKGALTPVSLPNHLLNSVVGYMNKGTPKSNISVASSPSLTSPISVVSQDGRSTPSVIQLSSVNPAKRKRHSSYTITQL